ncbi:uncharacterized protein LOC123537793 [Mercenaria mercenaria]|uniref:uncharacterized protein LOC123537793 n=1 Tax=Mercenaria mercenaria TaxID=6596 RepID=UPI00234E98A3|nr:uncharacterized protein LOC123537793 [Mercenaria mercenaria]XP_053380566.1 uncharacterized protein LOC123537793 [Mercenaria mercenaria]
MTSKGNPLSESTILRNHVFYQKSYVQADTLPVPTRSNSPVRYKPIRKTKPQAKSKPKLTAAKKRSSSVSPVRNKARNSMEQLEYRRLQRVDREKPWQEKPPKLKNSTGTLKLFYDRALPASIDKSKGIMRARKFVSNTKYGNIYEIREEAPKNKRTKSPEPRKWIWEDDFLLWMHGTRDKYMEDIGSTRNKQISAVQNQSNGSTNTNTPRPGSLPSIKEHGRPNAAIYASYNYHRLERTRRRHASIVLQRMFRGWYVRSFIKRLKRKALLEHGRPWMKFIEEYRELVSRIRSRYGMMKQSCRIDLKQLDEFLNRKHVYEKTFRQFAPSGKLHKDDLMEYFNRCDLWPTQREINRSFDTIFRGSRNTAEVVFLLDCSTSTGIVGFHNLIKFVKDLVHIMDIAPDRTRVGVVPFNEDVFSSFSITAYSNKRDVLEAISRINLWHGLTRTDLALRLMKEMFKDSRPGVQKIGIVLTDGQSTYHEKTVKEAQQSHEMGIEMFAIGIGSKADMSELQHIATNPDNLFHVLDVKSLGTIRRQIEKRFCLDTPTFAQIRASSTSHICRPIDQSEALEVLWTCYPPDGCSLSHVRPSRWIRPIVEGKEAWSMLDDEIIRATGMKACLRLVIQSRLQRHGYITVPSDVKDDVEHVTSETQALQIIEKFIEDRQKVKNGN